MRLYVQELRRILKSTRAKVVIILAVLLPILMALLANEFNDANYLDSDGNIVPLHGRDALLFIKENSAEGNFRNDRRRYIRLLNQKTTGQIALS